MRTYLRPSTLFGDKFHEYVFAPQSISVEKERQQEETRAKLIEKLGVYQCQLNVATANLQTLRESPGGIRGDWDLYKSLADQKAIAEQNIEEIEKRLRRLGS